SLVCRPIGSAGRHGRRLTIVWRECREHSIRVVRIRHVGVVVQIHAERLHVRYIDGAKQRLDISCEGNTRHTSSLIVFPTTVVNLLLPYSISKATYCRMPRRSTSSATASPGLNPAISCRRCSVSPTG